MREHFTRLRVAYGFTILFTIFTFSSLAINAEFKHYLGHKTSGPWKNNYPHTYKSLCASIAFDAFLAVVIAGFWYYLINKELSRYFLAYLIVALTYGVIGRFISGVIYLVSPDDQNMHDTLNSAFDQIENLDKDNIPPYLLTWKSNYAINIIQLIAMFLFGGCVKYFFVHHQKDRRRLIA